MPVMSDSKQVRVGPIPAGTVGEPIVFDSKLINNFQFDRNIFFCFKKNSRSY